MKNIIVPVDFSANSIYALEQAINIANTIDAGLKMIHIRKSKSFERPFDFEDFEKSQGLSVNDFFERLIKKYKTRIKTKIDYEVRKGKIYREIISKADSDDAYLIVMGTHGVSGFEEFWAGSNAFKVVIHSHCPVLTIRSGFLKRKIKKIVLPLDVTRESRQKVPFITGLAGKFNAQIHVCSVRESNAPNVVKRLENHAKQVCDYIRERNVKCNEEHLFGSNITEITIEYALSINAQLIVIMTEQTESTNNIMLGRYAQQMVNHSPVPVISYPSKR